MRNGEAETFHGALERLDLALGNLKWTVRVAWHDQLERILWWLAFHTPRRLCAYIHARVVGHATTGKWSRTNVPGIPAMEVAKRWEHPNEGPVEAPDLAGLIGGDPLPIAIQGLVQSAQRWQDAARADAFGIAAATPGAAQRLETARRDFALAVHALLIPAPGVAGMPHLADALVELERHRAAERRRAGLE